MAKRQSKPRKQARNAIDGQYTTLAYAKRHPRTTVVETRKKARRKAK
jgi:hypothetical protein